MRILIVDDEALARSRLMRMLERVPGAQVVGEADSGTAALKLLPLLQPDVVLLDVEMPGLDGLALADRPGLPPIIFTTAHAKFAADAFEVDAVDYLVKPVRQERLEKALDKVKRRGGPKGEPDDAYRLTVHEPKGVRFVDGRSVIAYRALDKYTGFTLDGEELLIRDSLDELEERLKDCGFLRVHRAGLVRRDAITGLESEGDGLVVRLSDGTSVEVSRRQAAELKRSLGLRKA